MNAKKIGKTKDREDFIERCRKGSMGGKNGENNFNSVPYYKNFPGYEGTG
jgi:hypothetical protein